VDTHPDLNVAAVLDGIGGLSGVEEFPTTAAGNTALLVWSKSFGSVTKVGVEGTGSYGALLQIGHYSPPAQAALRRLPPVGISKSRLMSCQETPPRVSATRRSRAPRSRRLTNGAHGAGLLRHNGVAGRRTRAGVR
jgi:hypothetical protein